jgi:hypothetical protein
MTRVNTNTPSGPVRVACDIYRLQDDPLVPVTTAQPGDELVLLVRVWTGAAMMPPETALAIELYRGEELRDRRRGILRASTTPYVRLLRLQWSGRAGASSRLTCRVRLGGQVVAERTVLLAAGTDAQGRFVSGAGGAAASAATRLACDRAFRALLGRFGESS